ncbi:MAG TPA: S8 family serine peptidase [Gemmatimonadaceae bacterium]|nr:S8 family serine peptidase [Gemmatimonadaceae bacterium]
MNVVRFTIDRPPFAGRTGHDVRVAVIDSGVTAGHPHVGAVAQSVRVDAGIHADDVLDRLGHGTAVAAVIREKAPASELMSVKVFDRALSTSAEALARGITWAADEGVRLINLSLGTRIQEREELLLAAIAHAASRGAIVVSAAESDGVRWLPGSLPGVAGVLLDWKLERYEIAVRLDESAHPSFRASGYPRPIPGVPRERNLSGASFSVANVTGFLARLLETDNEARTIADVGRLLASVP